VSGFTRHFVAKSRYSARRAPHRRTAGSGV